MVWRMEAASERKGKDATESAGANPVDDGPKRRPTKQVMIGGIRDAIFAR